MAESSLFLRSRCCAMAPLKRSWLRRTATKLATKAQKNAARHEANSDRRALLRSTHWIDVHP